MAEPVERYLVELLWPAGTPGDWQLAHYGSSPWALLAGHLCPSAGLV